tara:strand:- start:107 stop:442 length:336 start_codon:yes stop_codon:yes gene_type:complete
LKSRGGCQFGIWQDSDTNKYDIGVDGLTRIQHRLRDSSSGTSQASKPGTKAYINAPRMMKTGIEFADYRTGDTRKHSVRHLQHRHIKPELARNGSGFQTNISGSDDDHFPT